MNLLVETPAPPAVPAKTVSARLVSIDALRGFDMFWIMGGDYLLRSLPSIHDSAVTRALAAQMEHCEWAGFHFYDLIFPLFVFIVGVSLVFSLSRMIERDGRAAAMTLPISGDLAFALTWCQRASGGSQKTFAARYSSRFSAASES